MTAPEVPGGGGPYVAAPHPYSHVGAGRWVCEAYRVFIVHVDCPVNQAWASGGARSEPSS